MLSNIDNYYGKLMPGGCIGKARGIKGYQGLNM